MEFKREIHLNDENINAYTLSSITDVSVKRMIGENIEGGHGRVNLLKTKTMAIGVPSNWSGNVQNYGGYIFPRGAFVGDTQIYPPIITSYIGEVIGFDNAAGLFRLSNYTHIAEIGFENTNDHSNIIWPGVFKVTYSTTNPSILMSNLTNTNYFTTVSIPSFDTRVQNNNQWAYMRGNSIFIKDPLLTKQIPYKDMIEWGSSFPSSYYSYFRVDLDPSYITNANRILEKNVSEGVPYLYNNLENGVEITRRTCILGGMGENAIEITDSNTAITSDKITINSGTTSYNILKYYYKGQLLTDLTASLAYIMPKWSIHYNNRNYEAATHYSYMSSGSSQSGTGWFNTDIIGYGGAWPTYVMPFSVDNPTGSYFHWKHYANEAVTGEGPFGGYYKNFFIKFFNVFLIKVTGNEDMFSFGQSSLYYNRLTYVFGTIYPVGNITMNSASYDGFNNYIIGTNESNTPIHLYNSIPGSLIHNSEVMSIKHVVQPSTITYPIDSICPAVSIKHRFSTYLQEGVASPVRVMSYAGAKTFSDISSITYSTNNANNTTNITIFMNDHPNSNYWYNISASTPNTYTYCYIAADYMTNLGETVLATGRVISDSYLCIKKETVTINNTQTQTMYRSYYTSLMNSLVGE